jgi:hypothetical protein
MKQLLNKVRENSFLWFVQLVFVWVHFALLFEVTMITLSFVKPELATKIGNEIMWKIDGRFK